MKELVNESLAIAGGRLKRVQVITEIPDELTHHCFRARVGQILVNLLGNASDAFDEAGTQAPTIRIKVQRSTSNQPLRLEVSDNGPGIPPDIQARIFEKFYTTKEAGKGTGLGLAMCYDGRVAGGDLRIEPSAMGGATFLLELPLMQLPDQ